MILRKTMLVSLLTRKIYELRFRQVFGLLTRSQSPLRDSVGLAPTSPYCAPNIRVQTRLKLRICNYDKPSARRRGCQ